MLLSMLFGTSIFLRFSLDFIVKTLQKDKIDNKDEIIFTSIYLNEN